MTVCVPRFVTGETEDVHLPFVRNEELRTDERAQFECIRFPLVIRVDSNQTAPDLKPRLKRMPERALW
jgi:hypothetical protein